MFRSIGMVSTSLWNYFKGWTTLTKCLVLGEVSGYHSNERQGGTRHDDLEGNDLILSYFSTVISFMSECNIQSALYPVKVTLTFSTSILQQ